MADLHPEAKLWEMERLNVLAARERESLEARLAHASMHLSVLSATNTSLSEQLQAARDRGAADAALSAEERIRLEADRGRLESELDQARLEIIQTRGQIQEVGLQLQEVRQELADAFGEIAALKSTLSWRVTAPLRTAKGRSQQRRDKRG